jgi:hypothetical protein
MKPFGMAVLVFVLNIVISRVLWNFSLDFAEGFCRNLYAWEQRSQVDRVVAYANVMSWVTILCIAFLTTVVFMLMFWYHKRVVSKLKTGAT